MIRFAAIVALSLVLSGCGPTATLLYCMAVDHDINRKCQ